MFRARFNRATAKRRVHNCNDSKHCDACIENPVAIKDGVIRSRSALSEFGNAERPLSAAASPQARRSAVDSIDRIRGERSAK
jgi:hypothetical protein